MLDQKLRLFPLLIIAPMPCLYRLPVDPILVGQVATAAEESGKLDGTDAILVVVVEPSPATQAYATVTGRRFADGLRSGGSQGCPASAV